MRNILGAALLLTTISCAAIAQERPRGSISTAAISTSRSAEGGIAGPGEFATSFEASEGFDIGPLEPQNGFTASGVNANWASISNTNPSDGSQHLRLVRDSNVARGTTRVALSPSIGPLNDGSSITSLFVNISNYGGADYDIVGQAPSQGLLTWRVRFNFDNGQGAGNLFVLDDIGAGLQFIDTGASWLAGAHRRLRVEVDHQSNVIRYYYAESLIYTSVAGLFAATRVEQIGWVTDNLQLDGETADFDDLQLTIPEPSGFAFLLAFGAAIATRCRRSGMRSIVRYGSTRA